MGRPDAPIGAGVTARIVLHYVDGFDADEAPVVTCRPGARMDFYGAPMERTWAELGGDAEPGSKVVVLEQAVDGWKAGDEVIVTAGDRGAFEGDGGYRTEERTIVKVDGARVELDGALEYGHEGGGDFRCEVANLSRSVVIESANPIGVRGHTMFHLGSAGGMGYVRLADMGKRGVLGRYPVHFHQVKDSMRGASVVGLAVVNSHNRWVTVHGTEYMVVRDCVGYGSEGHGFFLEDGTEVYNVLDRNLAVQAYDGGRIDGQALTFDPNDGAGFWWANGKNTFVRNVACENEQYGFRYDSQKRSNFDPVLPVRGVDGRREKLDIRELPVFRFEGNEAHAEGLYGYAFAGTEGAGPDERHPHRLVGNTAWEVHYAFRMQLPTMLVERTRVERAAYGIYRPWFDRHVYRDLRIARTNTEPFNRGLDDKSLQHGSVTVDGLVFEGIRPSGMPLVQLSANTAGATGVETHLRNVRVEAPEGSRQRSLVDMGGGTRVKEKEIDGVPVYLHDWYGAGRHAKVVSSRSREFLGDGDGAFREEVPVTGDESRVREVGGVEFPELLPAVDDEPPATVVTWPVRGLVAMLGTSGAMVVRGTTTDNVKTAKVVVNGVEATPLAGALGFHEWEVVLEGVEAGDLRIEAYGVDVAGNVEETGHVLEVRSAE